MADMAYIASKTLEHKKAIAENNDLNTVFVPLIMMKEILAILKEQETLLKEQEAEIRQLRLALDIAKGTCNGIKVKRSVKWK